MKEIRLYNTAWKGLILILIALAFVAVGIWMISREPYGSTKYVMGWIGSCLFGLGIPIGIFNIFDKRPQLIINENGLWDRKSKQDEVKWEQIIEANISEIYNQPFISIATDVTFKLKNKQYSWAKNLTEAAGLAQFNISLGQIDANEAKLCELINSLSKAEKGDRNKIIQSFENNPKSKFQFNIIKSLLYMSISLVLLKISLSGMVGFMTIIICLGIAVFIVRWHQFGSKSSIVGKYARIAAWFGVVNIVLLLVVVKAKEYFKSPENKEYILTELGSYDFRRNYFGSEDMKGDSLDSFMNRNPEGAGFTITHYYDALVENQILVNNCLNLSKLDTLLDSFVYNYSNEIQMNVQVESLQYSKPYNKIGYVLNFNQDSNLILADTLEYNYPNDVIFNTIDINKDGKDELFALYRYYAINGDNYELTIYNLE
jgi:hypothetical protein